MKTRTPIAVRRQLRRLELLQELDALHRRGDPLPYLLIDCDRDEVPDYVVIDSAACDIRPAVRRTLQRQPYEDGAALWSRVVAQARALAAPHDPRLAFGTILCIYGELPAGTMGDQERNDLMTLRWCCLPHQPTETRLWGATGLAKRYGGTSS
jgi:hypothetical protein